jgi:hypothetical protein
LSSRHLLLRLHKKIILHLSSTTLEQKSLLEIKNLIQQNLWIMLLINLQCIIVIMNFQRLGYIIRIILEYMTMVKVLWSSLQLKSGAIGPVT